jgi:CRISPR-associated protein Cas1
MLSVAQPFETSEDNWADRCRYWAVKADETPARKRRERRTEPLILTGHGLAIRVDKGCLVVKGGHTHYPSTSKEQRFFRGSLDLPPRIVTLDGSGNLSLDALDWMAEQGIAFVRINYDGTHTAAFSANGYVADPALVAWQLATRDNPAKRLKFAKQTISAKLDASMETLAGWLPDSASRSKALETARVCKRELAATRDISVLLSIEGKAAQNYWRAWQAVEMRWKAQTRYPIPDEWRTFKARSSVLSGQKWKNWKASHPINAMLNYAYAVLLTDMRIKTIAEGCDPWWIGLC